MSLLKKVITVLNQYSLPMLRCSTWTKNRLVHCQCLGGGIGKTGNVCGAVSGSILILGHKYGFFKEEEINEGKERVYSKVQKKD